MSAIFTFDWRRGLSALSRARMKALKFTWFDSSDTR